MAPLDLVELHYEVNTSQLCFLYNKNASVK